MEGKLQVLLVEDSYIHQSIVSSFLMKYNHIVTIANNGSEAIEKFQQNNYDVILLTLMTPLAESEETTLKIREIEHSVTRGSRNRTPIIGLTSYKMDSEPDKSAAFNIDELLVTPYDLDKLMSIIYGKKYYPDFKMAVSF